MCSANSVILQQFLALIVLALAHRHSGVDTVVLSTGKNTHSEEEHKTVKQTEVM